MAPTGWHATPRHGLRSHPAGRGQCHRDADQLDRSRTALELSPQASRSWRATAAIATPSWSSTPRATSWPESATCRGRATAGELKVPTLFDAAYRDEPVRGAMFSIRSPMLDQYVSSWWSRPGAGVRAGPRNPPWRIAPHAGPGPRDVSAARLEHPARGGALSASPAKWVGVT